MQSSSQSWKEFITKSTLKSNEEKNETSFGVHISQLYNTDFSMNPNLMEPSTSKSLKRKFEIDDCEPNPKIKELQITDNRPTCPEPMDICQEDTVSPTVDTSLMINSICDHSDEHSYALR